MSISLLSLIVGHDGPATMSLNVRSLEFGISIYSDFCVSKRRKIIPILYK